MKQPSRRYGLSLRAAAVLHYEFCQLTDSPASVDLLVRQEPDPEAPLQLDLNFDAIELIAPQASGKHSLAFDRLSRQTLLLGYHHPYLVKHAQV